MDLLRPLLLDTVPSVQQSAALALGRLADYSDELAEAVVTGEILPQLVYALSEQNVCIFKKILLTLLCSAILKNQQHLFYDPSQSTVQDLHKQLSMHKLLSHWCVAWKSLILV